MEIVYVAGIIAFTVIVICCIYEPVPKERIERERLDFIRDVADSFHAQHIGKRGNKDVCDASENEVINLVDTIQRIANPDKKIPNKRYYGPMG